MSKKEFQPEATVADVIDAVAVAHKYLVCESNGRPHVPSLAMGPLFREPAAYKRIRNENRSHCSTNEQGVKLYV